MCQSVAMLTATSRFQQSHGRSPSLIQVLERADVLLHFWLNFFWNVERRTCLAQCSAGGQPARSPCTRPKYCWHRMSPRWHPLHSPDCPQALCQEGPELLLKSKAGQPVSGPAVAWFLLHLAPGNICPSHWTGSNILSRPPLGMAGRWQWRLHRPAPCLPSHDSVKNCSATWSSQPFEISACVKLIPRRPAVKHTAAECKQRQSEQLPTHEEPKTPSDF